MPNARLRLRRLAASRSSRQVWIAIATSVLASLASVGIGLLANASGDALLLIAVVAIALTFAILLPAIVGPMQIISDFLRLTLLDVGLLGGLPWHPDLNISGLELPDHLREGQSHQEIRVDLVYKPLVAAYRGPVSGSASLISDPPVLEFTSCTFELSTRSTVKPLQFVMSASPFKVGPLVRAVDRRQLVSGSVRCRLYLAIESPWELRLFDSPDKRSVKLDIGTVSVVPIGIPEWTERMVGNGYLTVLPNRLSFNPVITSPKVSGVGTNIAIAGRRWLADLDSGDPEAELLLQIASRMLAHELSQVPSPVTLIIPLEVPVAEAADSAQSTTPLELRGPPLEPPKAIEADKDRHQTHKIGTEGGATKDAASGSSAPDAATALATDINPAALTARLAQLTATSLDEIGHTSRLNAVTTVVPAPHTRQSYRLFLQYLPERDRGPGILDGTISILGFEDLPRDRCLLTVTRETDSVDGAGRAIELASVVTHILGAAIYQYRDSSRFESALQVPPQLAQVRELSRRHELSLPDIPGIDDLDHALEILAARVRNSGAVTQGLYIQPQPELDTHWVDLARLSEDLYEDGAASLPGDVLSALIKMLRKMLNSTSGTIYNCCTARTTLSDRRFAPLIGWEGNGAVTVQTYLEGDRWYAPEPQGDVFIVSALSNDWRHYDALVRSLWRKGNAVALLPVFSSMQPREITQFQTPDDAEAFLLPLLVWDSAARVYVPSTQTRKFATTWNIVRRNI